MPNFQNFSQYFSFPFSKNSFRSSWMPSLSAVHAKVYRVKQLPKGGNFPLVYVTSRCSTVSCQSLTIAGQNNIIYILLTSLHSNCSSPSVLLQMMWSPYFISTYRQLISMRFYCRYCLVTQILWLWLENPLLLYYESYAFYLPISQERSINIS